MTPSKHIAGSDSRRITVSLTGISSRVIVCLIASAMTGCGSPSDSSNSNGNTAVNTSDMASMLTRFGPDMDGAYLIVSQAEEDSHEAVDLNNDASLAVLTLTPVNDREAQ